MRKAMLIKTTALSLVAAITITTASPVVSMAAENNGPNTDNSATVSTGEVQQALAHTPGVLGESDQSKTISDADSAIVAATAGATIDVPKDASDGVTLATSNGPSLDIQLPNANQAADAKQVAPGVVAYSGNNGSANAVQTDETGGVRMLTIIDNPNAPTTYDYKVILPEGGHIEITPDGGAVVLGINSQPISQVSPPWAKDAHNKPINTWFETDGMTLTQHVQHNAQGVVYPVTADPFWIAISPAIFWWAVSRCGTWGSLGLIAQYAAGNTSPRALAVAGAFGCMSSFVGGGWILKQMFRIIKW